MYRLAAKGSEKPSRRNFCPAIWVVRSRDRGYSRRGTFGGSAVRSAFLTTATLLVFLLHNVTSVSRVSVCISAAAPSDSLFCVELDDPMNLHQAGGEI